MTQNQKLRGHATLTRVRRQGEAVCRNEYEAVLNRVSVVGVGNTTMSARWRYEYGATFMASVHSASQREVLNYLPKSVQEKAKQVLHDEKAGV